MEGQCVAPQVLELKRNAQVILLKNLDNMLVNGSVGTVIGFLDESKFRREGVLRQVEPENKAGVAMKGEGEGKEGEKRKEEEKGKEERKEEEKGEGEKVREEPPYPIVRFANGREIPMFPEEWKIELPGK